MRILRSSEGEGRGLLISLRARARARVCVCVCVCMYIYVVGNSLFRLLSRRFCARLTIWFALLEIEAPPPRPEAEG